MHDYYTSKFENIKKAEEEILDNINNFYKENSNVCDELYKKASSDMRKKYDDIQNDDDFNTFLLKSSIVLITANKFEKNILHIATIENTTERIKHYRQILYTETNYELTLEFYFFRIEKYYIVHVHAQKTGSYTMGGSADIVRYITENDYCYPSAIISYGICFGNDYSTQKIGDTIIVKKLYPYFMSAKIKESKYIVEDSNIFKINTVLEAKIDNLFLNNYLTETQERVYFGNMITGEAVLSNISVKNIVTDAATNQVVLGGEMEGYGLFKECQGFGHKIPCLIIKSICDWGAQKNTPNTITDNIKDKLQAFAANRACNILFKLLYENTEDLFQDSIYEEAKSKIFDINDRSNNFTKDFIIDIVKSILKSRSYKINSSKVCEQVINEFIEEKLIKLDKKSKLYLRVNIPNLC